MSIDQIVAQYGLVGLLLGAGIEGETVVVIGGTMVHRGVFGFLPAVAAASVGSFVADQLFFLLGRRFRNHSLVQKAQHRPGFAKAIAAFDKRPTLFVFGFRFLYGLRTISPIAIGTTRLPARKFLLLNAIAAVAWGTVFVTIGYCFGTAIEAAFGRLRSVGHLAFAVLGVVAIVAVVVAFIKRRHAD